LDDGAYLIAKLLIDLAKLKLENKQLTNLINNLEEPLESEEIRLIIKEDNFKEYGNDVIEKLKDFANKQDDWQIVPNNYEGVRISCLSEQEKGWFLLRLSLHDPVIPINIESNVKGGLEKITIRLFTFLESFSALEK